MQKQLCYLKTEKNLEVKYMDKVKYDILMEEYSEKEVSQLEQEDRLRSFNIESLELTVEDYNRQIDELTRKRDLAGNLMQDEYDRLAIIKEMFQIDELIDNAI